MPDYCSCRSDLSYKSRFPLFIATCEQRNSHGVAYVRKEHGRINVVVAPEAKRSAEIGVDHTGEIFRRHVAHQIATLPDRQSDRMPVPHAFRSEEHTSELQSLMRISYAVFCLKKKKHTNITNRTTTKTNNT